MNKLLVSMATLGLMAGCAHQQEPKPVPMEMTSRDMTVTPPNDPQLAVRSSGVNDSKAGREELDAALRNATVYFDFNSAQLSAEGQRSLQNVGAVMKKYPELKVQISGNADERGTEEYNLALGQRRAEMARQYLHDLGVQSSQLDTISYGDERPIDPSHTPDAWSKNRRDELTVDE